MSAMRPVPWQTKQVSFAPVIAVPRGWYTAPPLILKCETASAESWQAKHTEAVGDVTSVVGSAGSVSPAAML